jgi:hypothetical protein
MTDYGQTKAAYRIEVPGVPPLKGRGLAEATAACEKLWRTTQDGEPRREVVWRIYRRHDGTIVWSMYARHKAVWFKTGKRYWHLVLAANVIKTEGARGGGATIQRRQADQGHGRPL